LRDGVLEIRPSLHAMHEIFSDVSCGFVDRSYFSFFISLWWIQFQSAAQHAKGVEFTNDK
jgi:hypothetical protein